MDSGRIQEAGLDVDPTDAPRAALNQIADDWPGGEIEPDGIDLTLATSIAVELESRSEQLINSIESETTLSHRESQVWVLHRTVEEDDAPLTKDAIGIYLLLTGDADDYITPQAIQSYLTRVEQKIGDAKQTLLWTSDPNHEQRFDDPSVVWLEDETARRLRNRAQREGSSFDELVQNLLDETQRSISVRELVELYRDQHDAVQVAVSKDSIELEKLMFTVHIAPIPETHPPAVQEADVVTVGEKSVPFSVDYSPHGPQDAFRVSLYASQNIIGMDPVPVEEGLESLRTEIEKHNNGHNR